MVLCFLLLVTTDLISTAEMSEWLTVRERVIRSSYLSVDHEQYYGRGSYSPPDDLQTLTKQQLVYTAVWKAFFEWPRYRIEKRVTAANESAPTMPGLHVSYVWDGVKGATRSRRRNLRTYDSFNFTPGPTDSHFGGDWLWWLGAPAPDWNPTWGFRELLEGELLTGPNLLEAGETEWRGRLEPSPNVVWTMRAERRGESIRLTSLKFEYYQVEKVLNLEDGLGEPFCRITVHYNYDSEDESVVNEWLAPAARIVKTYPTNTLFDGQWGVILVRLREFGEWTANESSFELTTKIGDQVADTRYRVGYRIGDTYINLDGRMFQTNKPLSGDVGANLSTWLADGRFLPMQPPTIERSDSRSRPWYSWAPVPVCVAGALIVLFFPRLRKSKS